MITRFVKFPLWSLENERARPKSASFKFPSLSISKLDPAELMAQHNIRLRKGWKTKLKGVLNINLLCPDGVLDSHDNNAVQWVVASCSTGEGCQKDEAVKKQSIIC